MGLAWIARANELGNSLRNPDRDLIWNAIGPRRHLAKYWKSALGFVRTTRKTGQPNLRVTHEGGPDHFGWLRYAFGEYGLSHGSSPVAGQGS